MTMPALGAAHRIEIHSPDGAAALELECRLASLGPTAVCRHERWLVELAGVHDVDEIDAEVRLWLRHIGTPATTVEVDGSPSTVEAEPRRQRHRATHADFIG